MDLLFTKYLRASISYERISRIETYPFPDAAIRETILNALGHKDYSSGAPIQISVYDDKIIIWNSGQLPEGWTIEKLKQKHSSVPYNPDIATSFFRSGYIESWGRGIEKINHECITSGVPMPEFNTDFSGLMVTFNSDMKPKVGEKVGDRVGEKPDIYLTKNQEEILLQINSNPRISARQLSAIIGMSSRKIEENIAKLKKISLLKRVGGAKGGYWELL